MTQDKTEDQAVQQLLADLSVQSVKTKDVWHSGHHADVRYFDIRKLVNALEKAPVSLLRDPQVILVLHQIEAESVESEWWQELLRGAFDYFDFEHFEPYDLDRNDIRALARAALRRAGIG